MQSNNFLYRALCSKEIVSGNLLIPKSSEPFHAPPRLGIDTRLPFKLGSTTEYVVRQHQWKQRGYPTRGVSTTPHLTRAQFYAQRNRIIAKIDRNLLSEFDIEEFNVNELLSDFPEDIAAHEDSEIILVYRNNGTFPKDIISEILVFDSNTLQAKYDDIESKQEALKMKGINDDLDYRTHH